MKKMPGIKIQYKINLKTGIKARYFISEGIPSRDFASSPEIRKAINEFGKNYKINPIGRELGFIRASVKENKLDLIDVCPFWEYKEFIGKKIGRILENRFRAKITEVFPSVKKVREWEPNTPRIKSNKKAGLKNPYTVNDWKKKFRRPKRKPK